MTGEQHPRAVDDPAKLAKAARIFRAALARDYVRQADVVVGADVRSADISSGAKGDP